MAGERCRRERPQVGHSPQYPTHLSSQIDHEKQQEPSWRQDTIDIIDHVL